MYSKIFVLSSILILSIVEASPTFKANHGLQRRASPNFFSGSCGHRGCGSGDASEDIVEVLHMDSLPLIPASPKVAHAIHLPAKNKKADFNINAMPKKEKSVDSKDLNKAEGSRGTVQGDNGEVNDLSDLGQNVIPNSKPESVEIEEAEGHQHGLGISKSGNHKQVVDITPV